MKLRTNTRRLLAGAMALALVLPPAAAGAAKQKTPAELRRERQRVRDQQAQIASQIDVLKASSVEIQRAVDALERNLSGQAAVVETARVQAQRATELAARTKAAEAAKAAEVRALRRSLKRMAVQAYVDPAIESFFAALEADTLSESVTKRELLDVGVGQRTDVLRELRTVRADLADARAVAEDAARRAEQRKAAVETQLGALRRALGQQERVKGQIEERLEAKLAQAQAFVRLDAQLAARIRAEEQAAARRGGGRGGPRAGVKRGNVTVTNVRGIVVNTQIADQVERLLAAAEAAGIVLGGGGYRENSAQIALRRSHCGPSDYDIYEKPASECRPPTARPGNSMHEQGLAIDFTHQGRVIATRNSPAFQWLRDNAGRYGLRNLPSEPWHWSTNGR